MLLNSVGEWSLQVLLGAAQGQKIENTKLAGKKLPSCTACVVWQEEESVLPTLSMMLYVTSLSLWLNQCRSCRRYSEWVSSVWEAGWRAVLYIHQASWRLPPKVLRRGRTSLCCKGSSSYFWCSSCCRKGGIWGSGIREGSIWGSSGSEGSIWGCTYRKCCSTCSWHSRSCGYFRWEGLNYSTKSLPCFPWPWALLHMFRSFRNPNSAWFGFTVNPPRAAVCVCTLESRSEKLQDSSVECGEVACKLIVTQM